MSRFQDSHIIVGIMAVFIVILLWQGTHPRAEVQPPPVTPSSAVAACNGQPIAVSYPYRGQPENPHECKVQCEDKKPRYIVYTNSVATQCEELPGCNDWGEDRNITCVPASKK
jgi:hypothetical protein